MKPRLVLSEVPATTDHLDIPGFPYNPGDKYREVRERCSLNLNESSVVFPRGLLKQAGGKQKLNVSVFEFTRLIAHVAASHGCSVPDQLLGVTNLIENFGRTLPTDCELLAVPGGYPRKRSIPQFGRIVASGPSLSETMTPAMLHDAIWCDSAAFLAWRTYGEYPRYVAALERTPGIDKYFPPEAETRGCTLYTVPSVSPGVLRNWKGTVRFLVQDFPSQASIFPGVSPIASGASVASLALAVVQYSGLIPVFHGLDLCYSGEASHVTGLNTGEEQKNSRRDVVAVDGVVTNSIWKYIGEDLQEKLAARAPASSDPESNFGIRINRPGTYLPVHGLRAECPPSHYFSKPVSTDGVLLVNSRSFLHDLKTQAASVRCFNSVTLSDLFCSLQDRAPLIDDIVSPCVVAVCNLVNGGQMESDAGLSLLAKQCSLASAGILKAIDGVHGKA